MFPTRASRYYWQVVKGNTHCRTDIMTRLKILHYNTPKHDTTFVCVVGQVSRQERTSTEKRCPAGPGKVSAHCKSDYGGDASVCTHRKRKRDGGNQGRHGRPQGASGGGPACGANGLVDPDNPSFAGKHEFR